MDSDAGADGNEHWLSGWEQQCADSIEAQPDFEESFGEELADSHRKVWSVFQDSATAIAQLYRDRCTAEPASIWISFQTAAGTVTTLYKESCESIRRSCEMAKQSGYQKRNRELLNWAKRKRAVIRREDLLAYLSGKPPPPPTHRHHHHHHHHSNNHSRLSPKPRNVSPSPSHLPPVVPTDPLSDLNTFRDALMRSPSARRNVVGHDLCSFISGEIQRHTKRPASPSDVIMGSPTQKKPRYM